MVEFEAEYQVSEIFARGIENMPAGERAALVAAFEELAPVKLVKARGRNLLDFLGKAGELGLAGTVLVGEKILESIGSFFSGKPEDEINTAQTGKSMQQNLRTALGEKWDALRRDWKKYIGSEELVKNLDRRRSELAAETPPQKLSAEIVRNLAFLSKKAGALLDPEYAQVVIGEDPPAGPVFAATLSALAGHYDIPQEDMPEEVLFRRVSGRIHESALENAQLGADDLSEQKTADALLAVENGLRALPGPGRDAILESLGPAALSPEGLWNLFRTGFLSERLALSPDFTGGEAIAAGIVVNAVSSVSLESSLPLGLYGVSAVLAAVVLNPLVAILLAAGLGTFLFARAEKTIAVSLLESSVLKILQSAARGKISRSD